MTDLCQKQITVKTKVKKNKVKDQQEYITHNIKIQ